MKSVFAFTKELDRLNIAVKELKKQVEEQGPLLKNSVGLVVCDFDVDLNKLVKLLNKNFDFPLVGCTSIAMLTNEGYQDQCITLMVLTADDCEFVVDCCEAIESAGEFNAKVSAMYERVRNQSKAKEKLIFSFAANAGSSWEVSYADLLVKNLDRLTKGTPILGGCSSDDFSFEHIRVFKDNVVITSGVVCVFIYGNVKPIFGSEMSAVCDNQVSWTVTNSKGSRVYSLDEKPVTDAIKSIGLIPEDAEGIKKFFSIPFIIKQHTEGDNFEFLRSLSKVDCTNDYCDFMGNISEGSVIHYGFISEELVRSSVKVAFDKLLSRLSEESDYKYSTIFCISCAARYCLIVSDKSAESSAYMGKLPEGINLSGFYSLGEFCPKLTQDKKISKNTFNNETFVFLAI